ncbi:ATP-binding cassette domain-containing protein [Actibacterium lipolyticum]|uniref:Macrolide export ATP-binding/permease protein MacB n=1 Tax=Actibacterium lipolyticum TaxID=1524263 RepID=A0A238KP66_9RHOB|nr:ATP-binding cassette domain-containing protein [Actibacterium lipolyticum]SMX44447.1 Macrolide export ATP-binding/permease protein MacB [Actibacterium lipolyticum]
MTLSLNLSDLMVTAPGGRVLLNVPSLQLAAGQTLGIAGPSGAGKSTLLFALAGLVDNQRGRVRWGGDDLGAMRPAQRAAFRQDHIGMIFQDFMLFDELGGAANAGIAALFQPRAARAHFRKRAAERLTRLGVADGARPVATYSGGERQRVAVARAMAAGAGVLLADEPTASLHRDAADALTDDLLRDVRESGTTMIVVSHDAGMLGRMDRVVYLRDGGLADA